MARSHGACLVSARLDSELGARFQAYADAHRRSTSEAVRDLLAIALAQPLSERELRALLVVGRVSMQLSESIGVLQHEIRNTVRRELGMKGAVG